MFSVAYKARNEKKNVIRHRGIIDINAEVKLLQEIKDILDELNIMTTLLREQQTVCKSFTRHIQSILRGAVAEAEAKDELLDPPSEATARTRKRYKKTLVRAGDLLTSIEERIFELQRLVDTANETSSAVSFACKIRGV
jgi:ABC-type methionine transport system ATPase subunit